MQLLAGSPPQKHLLAVAECCHYCLRFAVPLNAYLSLLSGEGGQMLCEGEGHGGKVRGFFF